MIVHKNNLAAICEDSLASAGMYTLFRGETKVVLRLPIRYGRGDAREKVNADSEVKEVEGSP